MGIDLEVMASHFREHRGEMLSTATLRFDRDARLFSQLDRQATPCLVRPLADGLKVGRYEEDGLIWTQADRYGSRLTFTTPEDLRDLETPPELAAWNKAVLTFILGLPDGTKVVLYWC